MTTPADPARPQPASDGGGRLPWLAWSGYFSVTDNERTTWQIALRWCGDGISE